ncbi:MAG TPA: hypothetical protein VMK84_30710 [Streptosporangiaceae bacterium]|nr:hypothetical protein [Streptosporangiaceae bacterium]
MHLHQGRVVGVLAADVGVEAVAAGHPVGDVPGPGVVRGSVVGAAEVPEVQPQGGMGIEDGQPLIWAGGGSFWMAVFRISATSSALSWLTAC